MNSYSQATELVRKLRIPYLMLKFKDVIVKKPILDWLDYPIKNLANNMILQHNCNFCDYNI